MQVKSRIIFFTPNNPTDALRTMATGHVLLDPFPVSGLLSPLQVQYSAYVHTYAPLINVHTHTHMGANVLFNLCACLQDGAHFRSAFFDKLGRQITAWFQNTHSNNSAIGLFIIFTSTHPCFISYSFFLMVRCCFCCCHNPGSRGWCTGCNYAIESSGGSLRPRAVPAARLRFRGGRPDQPRAGRWCQSQLPGIHHHWWFRIWRNWQ